MKVQIEDTKKSQLIDVEQQLKQLSAVKEQRDLD